MSVTVTSVNLGQGLVHSNPIVGCMPAPVTRECKIKARINEVKAQIAVWEDYLKKNVVLRNWHGVEDAASDIRDFEAEIKALEWVMSNE